MAISPKLLTDGEKIVVDTRTHPKAIAAPGPPARRGAVLAIWLDQQVGVTYAELADLGILAAVVLVVWVLKPLVEWLTATYTITTSG